jgi:hypothetical protein
MWAKIWSTNLAEELYKKSYKESAGAASVIFAFHILTFCTILFQLWQYSPGLDLGPGGFRGSNPPFHFVIQAQAKCIHGMTWQLLLLPYLYLAAPLVPVASVSRV